MAPTNINSTTPAADSSIAQAMDPPTTTPPGNAAAATGLGLDELTTPPPPEFTRETEPKNFIPLDKMPFCFTRMTPCKEQER